MAVITLTHHERLWLFRIRMKLTQHQRATALGVKVDRYRDWETGVTAKDIPRIYLNPKVHEMCRLRRRREGMTQQQLADAVGVSRLWVVKMERGEAPSGRLANYWSAR
jgi:transcriptional regulator with XRE-family HTH domain